MKLRNKILIILFIAIGLMFLNNVSYAAIEYDYFMKLDDAVLDVPLPDVAIQGSYYIAYYPHVSNNPCTGNHYKLVCTSEKVDHILIKKFTGTSSDKTKQHQVKFVKADGTFVKSSDILIYNISNHENCTYGYSNTEWTYKNTGAYVSFGDLLADSNKVYTKLIKTNLNCYDESNNLLFLIAPAGTVGLVPVTHLQTQKMKLEITRILEIITPIMIAVFSALLSLFLIRWLICRKFLSN